MNIDEHSLSFFCLFAVSSLTEPRAHWLSVLDGWPMSSRDPLYHARVESQIGVSVPSFYVGAGGPVLVPHV